MADNKLEIIIEATADKAKRVIQELGDDLKGSFKIGLGVGAAGLGLLGAGFGIAINEAMGAQQEIAELNAVIESTGGVAGITSDEAQNMADSLMRLTGISDDTIIATESMLLTFTNIGEDVFPQATEAALDMGVKFGSAENAAVQLGKALNDPVEGVSALRRVGVTFTQQQEDQIKTMMEAGDIAGAQAVILAELNKEFGGLARAAGQTAAGKLKIFMGIALNVAESIGMKLLPVMMSLLDNALIPLASEVAVFADTFVAGMDLIITAVEKYGLESMMAETTVKMLFGQNLGEKIYEFALAFEDVANAVKGFVQDALIPFVTEHAEGFKTALIAMGAVLGGAAVLGGILTLGGAIAALANPLTLIIGAVGLLAMAWSEDWGGIRTYITDTVWPAVEPILATIKEWLEVNLPKALDALKTAWEGGLPGIVALIGDLGNAFVDWIEPMIPVMLEKLGGLAESMWNWLSIKANSLILKLGEWGQQFIDWIGPMIPPMLEMLAELATSLFNWVAEQIPVLISNLYEWQTQFLGWITPMIPPLLEKLGEFLGSMLEWVLGTAVPGLILAVADMQLAILQWIVDAIPLVVPKLTEFLVAVVDFIKTGLIPGIIEAAKGIGAGIVDGIKLGIDNLWEGLKSDLAGKVGDLVGSITDGLGISSPSKVFAEIGRNMVEGLAVGMQGFDSMVTQPAAYATQSAQNMGRGGNISNSRLYNYNLTVHSNAQAEDVISDFRMMQSWAGG